MLVLRPIESSDQETIQNWMIQHWGAEIMVVHGTIYHLSTLPGFLAFADGHLQGIVTYHLSNNECEITSLDSLREGAGIGSALVQAVKEAALAANCHRLWLITTNDNLNALRFYQKRGFELVAVHRRAVEKARQIKPEIPLFGNHGIPIRDEIELEMVIGQPAGQGSC